MTNAADPKLVIETPIWENYHLEAEPEESPKAVNGEDEQLRALTGKPIIVLLPPPPSVYCHASLFQDTLDDNQLSVYQRSRRALIAYQAEYEELKDFPYPLRVKRACHVNLPAFLNGYLTDEDLGQIAESPTEVAAKWLFQDLRGVALFGAEADFMQEALIPSPVVRQTPKFGNEKAALLHVRYQQQHPKWPVFGGSVVVHLATEDPRVSVTSSYFPLPSDLDFLDEVIDEAQAIGLAQQALAAYLDGPQAIGFYWYTLRFWLRDDDPDRDLPWGAIETRIAHKQLEALARFSRDNGGIFPEIEEIVGADQLPETQADLLALLKPAQAQWINIRPGQWQAQVALYASFELFILPFAGGYYLARQIEFLSPTGDQAWRVFVDTQQPQVLGRPESLIAQAHTHYPTTNDVLNNSPTDTDSAQLPAPFLTNLAADIAPFMQLTYHPDHPGAGGNAVNLATLTENDIDITNITGSTPADLNKRVNGEAINIARHARAVYDHFAGMVSDVADLQSYIDDDGNAISPGLEVAVGMAGPDLAMGFDNASLVNPKLITFQTDNGSGLNSYGRKVFGPSLDREVVYHELIHAFMWLLNRNPFDQKNDNVPFGRALVEGYANYFARSLANLDDPINLFPPATGHWARAAYKDSPDQWANDWSLSRPDQIPGADLLPAPNLYPSIEITGLAVYYAGMVWARALWDIRQALKSELTDRLALDAFHYVHGWVTNFEIAAEGLIDEARKSAFVDEETITSIITKFAKRGILAEQGIQALARVEIPSPRLYVGTDQGLKFSLDGGETWSNTWEDLSGGAGSSGVVALAVENAGPIVYAATEDAVYRRDLATPGNTWIELGAGSWPVGKTPLCLFIVDDTPYVGTGHGVYQLNGAWQQWGHHTETDLEGLALYLAGMQSQTGNNVLNLYAAMIAGVMLRARDPADPDPSDLPWENPGQITNTLVTTVVAQGNTVYAGTLNQGIYSQTETLAGNFTPWGPPLVPPESIGNSAVLCLAVDGAFLWVGTTSGFYKIAKNSGALVPVDLTDFPAGATVTAILPVGNFPLIGTARQGLWWRNTVNNVWEQKIPGI